MLATSADSPSLASCSDSHSMSSSSSTSTTDKLPVELWSLIVSFLAARRGQIGSPTQPHDDPHWRRDLLRLAHTCRAAYVASFTTLWSDLRVQFIRDDQEMTLELAKVENSVEEDVHVQHRLRQVRMLRRKFDLSLISPASKRLANRELVRRVEEISECALVAPLCIVGGWPYLASLAENEQDQQVSKTSVASSVKSLWASHLPADWECEVQFTANGLVLVPYPLHLIRHIALNDFDASVDLGSDLFSPNSPANRRVRQSWKYRLPFLLHLPNPLHVQSIQFYINSNATYRLYLELINTYPSATDIDIAFAGDHEHRISRFTPAVKRIRLHLDGDLDNFGDTPDLFYTEDEEIIKSLANTTLADTEPKPIYPEDALPFAVTSFEARGRTSYLPYDEEEVGMQFLYVLPTLTQLTIDHDFEVGNSDYGIFPIFMPALKELTICMRIADLIFSCNDLSSHLPAGQVAFPVLESLTLVNDLDQQHQPASDDPNSPAPTWPPMIPDIPHRHMPMLTTLLVPATFRGNQVHCSVLAGWMHGINLLRFLVPNTPVVVADPQHFTQAMTEDQDYGNFCVENNVTMDSAVILSVVPCRSLRKLTLNVHDSKLDPLQALPGLTWGKNVEELVISFTGSRTIDPSWLQAVTSWPKLRALTVHVTNATGNTNLIAGDSVLPQVVQLTLDMPDASVDLAQVSRAAFPQLQQLRLNVARAHHLSYDMLLSRLATLTVHDAPCPLVVGSLLMCPPPRETCRVSMQAPIESDPALAAVMNLDGSGPSSPTTAGPVDVEWTYTGTADNVGMWYRLLSCAPCKFGEAGVSKVTVKVAGNMDAVDAKLVGRVVRRLVRFGQASVHIDVVMASGVQVEGDLLALCLGNGKAV